MEKMTFKAEQRPGCGTKASQRLRAEGRMPAIIYGHGEPPAPITLAQHDVEVAISHGARTLDVDFGGETKPYLIKEVQYDHLQMAPIHLDLARVDLTEKVRVRVGIQLRGVPKGVHEGGVLDQPMGDLEVECLVTNIPDTLHPSVVHLGVGDSLLVRDLQLPEGVRALENPEDRVATVRLLIVHEAPAVVAPVEGEAAPAEPERIGRIKKEEEPEAES
jgi:large subunit ribosomal protein L25